MLISCFSQFSVSAVGNAPSDVRAKKVHFSSPCFASDLGFATEIALEEYVATNEEIFGAIVFVKSKWDDLPKTLSYKIRLRSDRRSSTTGERVKIKWNTNATFPDRDVMEPRNDTGPGSLRSGR